MITLSSLSVAVPSGWSHWALWVLLWSHWALWVLLCPQGDHTELSGCCCALRMITLSSLGVAVPSGWSHWALWVLPCPQGDHAKLVLHTDPHRDPPVDGPQGGHTELYGCYCALRVITLSSLGVTMITLSSLGVVVPSGWSHWALWVLLCPQGDHTEPSGCCCALRVITLSSLGVVVPSGWSHWAVWVLPWWNWTFWVLLYPQGDHNKLFACRRTLNVITLNFPYVAMPSGWSHWALWVLLCPQGDHTELSECRRALRVIILSSCCVPILTGIPQ